MILQRKKPIQSFPCWLLLEGWLPTGESPQLQEPRSKIAHLCHMAEAVSDKHTFRMHTHMVQPPLQLGWGMRLVFFYELWAKVTLSLPGWDRVPLLCPLFLWHRDLEINVLNGFLIRWRRAFKPSVTHLTRISLHVLSHWDLGGCLVQQHTHDMAPVLQNSILPTHFGNVL